MTADPLTIRQGTAADAEPLAALAAATFPLACPPHTPATDIADHVATELNPSRFAEHLADSATTFFVVERPGEPGLVGYAMLVDGPERPEGSIGTSPIELRRIYVAARHHGSDVADRLMARCQEFAATTGHDEMWLGTNEANQRAVRFYRRSGFSVVGSREFHVGASIECDHVMARTITGP